MFEIIEKEYGDVIYSAIITGLVLSGTVLGVCEIYSPIELKLPLYITFMIDMITLITIIIWNIIKDMEEREDYRIVRIKAKEIGKMSVIMIFIAFILVVSDSYIGAIISVN